MPRMLTPADVAEFRTRLCEVGAELFAEQGFEGFNMRELAKRLGVSAMTPYRYFKDKDLILAEVRARAFAKFADWLEAHLSAPGADEDTLGRAYAQYAIREHKQYRLMFDINRPPSVVLPGEIAQEQRVRKLISAHLRSIAERSHTSIDADSAGLVLWSVLHGITALYLAGKLSSSDFDRTLPQAVLAFAVSGTERKKSRPFIEVANSQAMPYWRADHQALRACESSN